MIATRVCTADSPFAVPGARALKRAKFQDPMRTADGAVRAHVALQQLETLWINTGTLCNLACKTCYIESSPVNDALVYLTLAEVDAYLEEAKRLGTREIGYTGGEPFMNPDMVAMMRSALGRGFEVIVLTNAMRPMRRFETSLNALRADHGTRLTMRVSLDHYTQALHEAERGPGSWAKAIDGCGWLSNCGFRLAIAGRQVAGESDAAAREGYARLFLDHDLRVNAFDPAALVLFPEMDETIDVPEISDQCWSALGKSPESVMCATSRMVVRRKNAPRAVVVACTLVPYDDRFVLGETIAEASGAISLNHPHCARFCVLGGASCSG